MEYLASAPPSCPAVLVLLFTPLLPARGRDSLFLDILEAPPPSLVYLEYWLIYMIIS